MSKKELLSRIYKEPYNSLTATQHFTKEDLQMTGKCKKKCSISLIMRKMHVKTSMRCFNTPTILAKIKKTNITKC